MYVFGDNSASGGQDYGAFNLFTDNKWIAQEILDTVPGQILEPGDVNRDGVVNDDDIAPFVAGWLSENVLVGAARDGHCWRLEYVGRWRHGPQRNHRLGRRPSSCTKH